ncbi:restriction endonuclease S subunit [Bifidobacterium bifidum LMG 13195]|uniref:Restriction endonuclease S subunit n=1 Tax=Bifidobacterium bifidum LMG 13195 TaxID=1207542 RepID=A0A286TA77_BIFBI|nr:restriction endonuclease S subunit [Bifidobacterium bifidum LMG 13195]
MSRVHARNRWPSPQANPEHHGHIDIVIEEHDGFVPELLFGLVRIKSDKSPRGLPRVHTTQHTMILIKQVIHTAVWQIGKTLRLAQHVSGHHDSDKRSPSTRQIRIPSGLLSIICMVMAVSAINYLPPFANSLIMHVLTNAEKLIPLRDAASLAESRRLAGMRMVTGTTSPSTRYERISVSPASCSIKSEYVIASHAFKPQYKCINYTPAWEQRKLGEVAHFINGRAYSQNELLFSGKYPVLRVGNFYTNDSWYYSDLELEDKNYAYEGDLLYTWSATFGPHIWHGNKVIYHYHIWKVQLEAALEKLFAFQLLERDKERILSDKKVLRWCISPKQESKIRAC